MTDVKTKTFCPECGEEFAPDSDLESCPNDGVRLQEMAIPGIDEEDPMLGVELDGRFVLESVLGEGGMGRVYRGRQLSVDREVAVKVLRSDLSKDENVVKRFFREARVISSFAHPNIVNLVDFGQDTKRGVLYLAMEFIDGDGLGGLLDRGRLRLPLVLDVAAQVCAALSEPHERGVVHRDLKPENLMVLPLSDGSLQVKVVDFGIAHAIDQTQNLTKTGAVHGTPYYMAPEQARGEEVSAATDLYALGVIMFEMISGTPPFDADTSMKIMFQHIEDPPPALTDFVDPETLPEELRGLVGDLLLKDPGERPGSALAVRERLQAIADREGYDSVMLDPTAPTEDLYEAWVLPRPEVADRKHQSSPPPGTGDRPTAPETGDLAEAETVAASQVDEASGPGDRKGAQEPEPTATRETAEQSPTRWLAIGAVGMLLFGGLAAGTALALTEWGGGDDSEGERAGGPPGEPSTVAAGSDRSDAGGATSTASEREESDASSVDVASRETDTGVGTDAAEMDAASSDSAADASSGDEPSSTGAAPGREGERAEEDEESRALSPSDEPSPAEPSPEESTTSDEPSTTEQESTAEPTQEEEPAEPDEGEAPSPEPEDEEREAPGTEEPSPGPEDEEREAPGTEEPSEKESESPPSDEGADDESGGGFYPVE